MKTKNLLLCSMLLGAILTTKAQTSNSQQQGNSTLPTGYAVAISLGSSTPVGSFSDRAQTGLNFNLSSQIPIKHSNFGIAITLGGQANSYNTQAFINASGGAISSASVNNFVSDNLLVGGFATIPLHRFSFDFRLMVGSMICEFPNITATDYAGNIYQYTFPTAKVGAIDIGAGVRYNLSHRLTLMLNWNYIGGASATFNGTATIDNSMQVPVTETRIFSVFNTTWGLGWII